MTTSHAHQQGRKNMQGERSEPQSCSTKDLQGFEAKLAEKWGFTPRQYQMEGINAQLQRKDALIHAGTGLGKTAVAAGPHAHPNSQGKVTLMVSPLIALHDEMVGSCHEVILRQQA